mmetsp:Transcript_10375/g.29607  ORF Transcript_10375/g.29607 Transcript_10375/m.29607 type:complete len:268 (+) Transcript_10375:68-871(+)
MHCSFLPFPISTVVAVVRRWRRMLPLCSSPSRSIVGVLHDHGLAHFDGRQICTINSMRMRILQRPATRSRALIEYEKRHDGGGMLSSAPSTQLVGHKPRALHTPTSSNDAHSSVPDCRRGQTSTSRSFDGDDEDMVLRSSVEWHCSNHAVIQEADTSMALTRIMMDLADFFGGRHPMYYHPAMIATTAKLKQGPLRRQPHHHRISQHTDRPFPEYNNKEEATVHHSDPPIWKCWIASPLSVIWRATALAARRNRTYETIVRMTLEIP